MAKIVICNPLATPYHCSVVSVGPDSTLLNTCPGNAVVSLENSRTGVVQLSAILVLEK